MRGFRILKRFSSVVVIAPRCGTHRGKLLRSVSHNAENCSAVCPTPRKMFHGVSHTAENCSAVGPTTWKKGWCFYDKICSAVCPTTRKIAPRCVPHRGNCSAVCPTPWKIALRCVPHRGKLLRGVSHNAEKTYLLNISPKTQKKSKSF